MLRETSKKGKRKGGRVIYPGICKAADALGVHRIHLYLVLSGRRHSRSLLARYHQLQGGRS